MFGKPASEVMNSLKKFSLLQTGESGHGKTTRMLDAIRFGKLCILDFDGKIQGSLRLRNEGGKTRPFTEEELALINVVEVKNMSLEQIMGLTKDMQKAFADTSQPPPFATIAVDTYTGLNGIAVRQFFPEDMTADKDGWKHWGKVARALEIFFERLYALPCNLIVNAHIGRSEDALGKEKWGVLSRGSYGHTIAGKVSDSHYLHIDNGKYKVRCRNSASLPANSQVDPKFIDAQGNLTIEGLSIFDNYAFKTR